jgi:hypothetical protein
MKTQKSLLSVLLLITVVVFTVLILGCNKKSNKTVSDCDTTYEPDKAGYLQNDYTLGYDQGKLNRNGGSSICDPYKNNKVKDMPGYVNDGQGIRRAYSDCFCKGFEAGYNSKE